MNEAPHWNPSNTEFVQIEQSMFNHRGQFVTPSTVIFNYVTFFAYDDADVMDDENFATVLKIDVIILWESFTNGY